MKSFIFLMLSFCFTTLMASDTATVCQGKKNINGEKHGVWICKKENILFKKERYKNGSLLTYILYNNKGEIIETKTKKGKIKKYEPCGCN
jgi:hypothetical protein